MGAINAFVFGTGRQRKEHLAKRLNGRRDEAVGAEAEVERTLHRLVPALRLRRAGGSDEVRRLDPTHADRVGFVGFEGLEQRVGVRDRDLIAKRGVLFHADALVAQLLRH